MRHLKKCIVILLPLFILLTSFYVVKSTRTAPQYNDSVFCDLQSSYGVSQESVIRNELYTWTSPEQVALLRTDHTLLTKSQSEKYGKSNYDLFLEEKKDSDNVAAFLLDTRYAKKRFSWPHPWATVRGYPGENYGDQLLRVTFKKDAIFGSAVVSYNEISWHFYTMDGREMLPDYAITKCPERIAVIYFSYSKKTTKVAVAYHGSYRPPRIRKMTTNFPYREYIICNEGMISSWSYGTQHIKNKMLKDISYLEMLKESIQPGKEKDGDDPVPEYYKHLYPGTDADWSGQGSCNYGNTLALVNSYYDLNNEQLNLTIDALHKAILAQSDSITVNYK